MKDIEYKFDPMDFETIKSQNETLSNTPYKFDPMDFETIVCPAIYIFKICINLILWILKLMNFDEFKKNPKFLHISLNFKLLCNIIKILKDKSLYTKKGAKKIK